MSPPFTVYYFTYLMLTDTKHFSQCGLCNTARRTESFYFRDIKGGQFRVLASLTDHHPSFPQGILYVFALRSCKQMMWIYTRSVIAFVTNILTLWNWSIVKNPRYATDPLGVICSEAGHLAVTASLDSRTYPLPTWSKMWLSLRNWTAQVNQSPKPFYGGWGKLLRLQEFYRIIGPRNQFHWLRHALGCWFTARAFSL